MVASGLSPEPVGPSPPGPAGCWGGGCPGLPPPTDSVKELPLNHINTPIPASVSLHCGREGSLS